MRWHLVPMIWVQMNLFEDVMETIDSCSAADQKDAPLKTSVKLERRIGMHAYIVLLSDICWHVVYHLCHFLETGVLCGEVGFKSDKLVVHFFGTDVRAQVWLIR